MFLQTSNTFHKDDLSWKSLFAAKKYIHNNFGTKIIENLSIDLYSYKSNNLSIWYY